MKRLKVIIIFARKMVNRFKFIRFRNVNKKILCNARLGLRLKYSPKAKLVLKGPCFNCEKNFRLYIRGNGEVQIGSGVYFNENGMIVCREFISIGDRCFFGPNVYICDHDHVFNEKGVSPDKFISSPVKIGNNTWVGANVIILKGSTIGDNCVIAAGSVITGHVPDNTIVIQKRINTFKVNRGNEIKEIIKE